ncbi:hypothetical protein R1sor_005638 [Riccia sorocarpa]|uniref:K Homology domain-containing protein n=1 Tax=Riccia sorocarpa TaxID=122646 RepID=A0ABD3HN46_9MARC
MSLRFMNQHLPEQFRRVASSDFGFVLDGCCSRRRQWPFTVSPFSEKPQSVFRQLDSSIFSAAVIAASSRSSSSFCCSFLGTRKVYHHNLQAQGLGFSLGLYQNSSSSPQALGLVLGEPQSFLPSRAAAFLMDQEKENREAMGATNRTKSSRKGNGFWKAKQRSRDISSVAEESSGGVAEIAAEVPGENIEENNPATDVTGEQMTASGSAASGLKSEEEVLTKEVHVDAMLLRFLVGKGGSTKEKIEKDCKVKLKVPSTHEVKVSKSPCIVTGTAEGIEVAQKKIKTILEEAVKTKLQYTHFISLPLANHLELLDQVEKFQEQILARNQPPKATFSGGRNSRKGARTLSGDKVVIDNQVKRAFRSVEKEKGVESSGFMETEEPVSEEEDGSSKGKVFVTEEQDVREMEKGVVEVEGIPHKSGIDKSIFVKPRTFHLTVLMLKLWNEERVQQAAEVLEKTQAAVHEALEGRPVALNFRGVETMRGKPDKAHVLYARVEDSAEKTRLLQACKVLTDAYVESGLVMEKDIDQSLKLHATLMNTTHRTVKKNRRFGKRIPFDATEILEQYGEWNWGNFGMLNVHLSQRFVYGESGYYHCVRSIPLPSHSDASSAPVESSVPSDIQVESGCQFGELLK